LIIEKYHETAKANGAIVRSTSLLQIQLDPNNKQMIPSTGIESAPADILAWALVKRVREDLSSPTRQINSTIKEMKYATSSLKINKV
jgi:hypothetical protein